jgi:alkanesulfonate monooxygenase SsuD/methylene tetrahydromethanopterin reductase-like flavin-dependent oxidoreductase (luciferase family)
MAYLAVEVSGAGRHPDAWKQAGDVLAASYHVELARLAARAGVDLLALADSFAEPADPLPTLDAVAIAARVAPVVPGIGLVPTVTVTHTEPFHVSKAIATLDLVSSGRAGWEVAVSRTATEAELFGRKPAAQPAELWREAAEAVEVVVRLWDSWEDDAVIRDAATGRYVDRDKLHYIDFTGEFFSVKGPSITPRSPQAHPLVVIRDEPDSRGVAAAWADVVRIAAPDLAAAHATRAGIRDAVTATGRDSDDVAVLLDVEALLGADLDPVEPSSVLVTGGVDALAGLMEEAVRGGAADGITLVPLALPGGLQVIADELAPRLGWARPAPGTLRERFGLARPANYFGVDARARKRPFEEARP